MTSWYFVVAGVTAAWAVGMGYWLTRKPPEALAPEDPAPVDHFQKPAPLPPGHVLYPAPRIGDFSLWSWLIHGCNHDGVWADVVSKFVNCLRSDEEVIQLFIDRGTNIEEFQIHFLSALKILTHTGLTVRLREQMRQRHAGLGITGVMFDRTILALAGILDAVGVPDDSVQQLLPAVQELRTVIVTA